MGFISFRSDDGILISTELDQPERLGVREDQSIKLHARHQAYLEFHRAELFIG